MNAFTRSRLRTLACAWALVTAALVAGPRVEAAQPTGAARYSGTTSQGEPAKFAVSRSARMVEARIGWIAVCESGALLRASTLSRSIRIDGAGRFSRKGSYETHVAGYLVHVELNLKGRFTSVKRAKGSLDIHAHVAGPDDHCHVSHATWIATRSTRAS